VQVLLNVSDGNADNSGIPGLTGGLEAGINRQAALSYLEFPGGKHAAGGAMPEST